MSLLIMGDRIISLGNDLIDRQQQTRTRKSVQPWQDHYVVVDIYIPNPVYSCTICFMVNRTGQLLY